MKRIVRKLHRYLGLIFSISILMSSGSGVIHIIMTRTQAPPPAAKPTGSPLDASAITVSPAQAFPETPLAALNIRNIKGKPFYQAMLPDSPAFTYIDATTGSPSEAADEMYAKQIASNFLGSDQVEKTEYLTSFNREYIGIFRILPVYRFDLNDGLGSRVYVSTLTGSVTRHTNDEKQFEANIFSNFHKLAFIRNKNARDWILATLTGAAFVISILGIVLFFLTRPRKSSVTN